jgi:hypothetical protein
VHGSLRALGDKTYTTATLLDGWVDSGDGRPSCVVVIDKDGKVIGAMVREGLDEGGRLFGFDGAERLVGVAKLQPAGDTYRAVAVFPGRQVLLSDEVTQT